MRVVLALFFLLSTVLISAQITLERQVISSFQLSGSGSIEITSTGGQVEYRSFSSSDLIITQGFEQPPGPIEILSDELVIYNGISPDDDGQNDYWHIDNIDLPQYAENEVVIVNRWGQIIWEANNYNNEEVRWDGKTDTGEELPSGTYYYLLETGEKEFKGFIEVFR